jgi:hypothetical protein
MGRFINSYGLWNRTSVYSGLTGAYLGKPHWTRRFGQGGAGRHHRMKNRLWHRPGAEDIAPPLNLLSSDSAAVCLALLSFSRFSDLLWSGYE